MNLLKHILTVVMAACALPLTARPPLFFDADGRFRLVQFTDLHLMPENADQCAHTESTIRLVVAEQQPQLAVLTGDVVTGMPADKGWKQIVGLFNELQLPFVVMMGNHDGEYVDKSSLYEYLTEASPWYVGSTGTSGGAGDSVLEILGHDRRPGALIYCIDSNDYQPDKQLGEYDWIHHDQIDWYRSESARHTQANGGTPLPALMFFHIPLVEYADIVGDTATFGTRDEGAGAPGALNSGMFASIVEMGDVMGVFVGHDHDNDYVGLNKRIALGFGRVTGADAYGKLTRGGRMFELYNGQRKFDTWIASPSYVNPSFHYPSGLNGVDELTMTYHKALPESRRGDHGVSYRYHEGLIKHTSQIDTTRLVAEGTMPGFVINLYNSPDHFAYRYRTLIDIPERGVYRFHTHSDDGSVLRIDGVTVVDNDGGHSARRREGKIALEAGLHELELDYFENYMGQELEVGITGRNLPETPIPASMLYLP